MKDFSFDKLLLCLALFGICLPAFPLQADQPELDKVLNNLKTAAARIETLQGSFAQEKNLEMFDHQLISAGAMVYVAPDQLRWELLTPVASGFVLQGEQGVRWNAVSEQVQRFSSASDPLMGVVARQLLAWARVDLEWLSQGYHMEVIANEPIVLRLTPLDTAEADLVNYIQVTFAPLQGHVSDVLVMEQSGDSTRLRFNDVRINDGVAAEAFTAPEF